MTPSEAFWNASIEYSPDQLFEGLGPVGEMLDIKNPSAVLQTHWEHTSWHLLAAYQHDDNGERAR